VNRPLLNLSLTQLFSDVDDFWQWFIPAWKKNHLKNGDKKIVLVIYLKVK